jgi:hypothetical protein
MASSSLSRLARILINEPLPFVTYGADTPYPMFQGMGQIMLTGAVIAIK